MVGKVAAKCTSVNWLWCVRMHYAHPGRRPDGSVVSRSTADQRQHAGQEQYPPAEASHSVSSFPTAGMDDVVAGVDADLQ